MLIDTRQRRWILITTTLAVLALVVHYWLDQITPGGLTGGSTVGLWYGLLGSAMMVFAGLLAAHRKFPTWWWIGSRKFWLKGHVWLSLLSVVMILCHSGFHWGGPLEQALWIVFTLTILTGIVGLLLQQVLPRLITLRISRESPYEQIPHLCEVMLHKADRLVDEIWAADLQVTNVLLMASQAGLGAKFQFQEFYEKHVRPFLNQGHVGSDLLTNPMKAEVAFERLRALPGLAQVQPQMDRIEALCDERRQMDEQERLHYWLHLWLAVHVPIAILLLFLGVTHAVLSLYY